MTFDIDTIIALATAGGGAHFIPKLFQRRAEREEALDKREKQQHEWEERVRAELDERLDIMERRADECEKRNESLLTEIRSLRVLAELQATRMQAQTDLIQVQTTKIEALQQEVDELRDALATQARNGDADTE